MKYQRNAKVYSKKIGQKWCLLEKNKKIIRELNEVGSLLWEMLAERLTIEDLVKQVCREYQVEPKTAEADVRKFLDEYVKEGYLVTSAQT